MPRRDCHESYDEWHVVCSPTCSAATQERNSVTSLQQTAAFASAASHCKNERYSFMNALVVQFKLISIFLEDACTNPGLHSPHFVTHPPGFLPHCQSTARNWMSEVVCVCIAEVFKRGPASPLLLALPCLRLEPVHCVCAT
eukprot:6470585-Amphidinium_carterae.1